MELDTVRAWKDEAYREGLSDAEREVLPESPVGAIEVTDWDLESAQDVFVPRTFRCTTFEPLCDPLP